MSMEINGSYSNYVGSYSPAGVTKEKEKTVEKATVENKKEQSESKRSSASDELAYLSKKYDGITFVAANFTPGMRYGSNATTNIAISPEFLKKMAADPELEKQYTDQFENMKKLDEQNIRMHEAQGRRLVAQGWAIDKNGGMSKWGISEATDKRHYGQEMTDYANKIRQQKVERKKSAEKIAAKKEAASEKQEAVERKRTERKEEQAVLKEKLDKDARDTFGDIYKGSELYDTDEDADLLAEFAKGKGTGGNVGVSLDMKL